MFIIEDEIHAEPQKEQFSTFKQALEKLEIIAKIPWNEKPNKCPCKSWKTSERKYLITEYDDSNIPWKKHNSIEVLKVSAREVKWNKKNTNTIE